MAPSRGCTLPYGSATANMSYARITAREENTFSGCLLAKLPSIFSGRREIPQDGTAEEDVSQHSACLPLLPSLTSILNSSLLPPPTIEDEDDLSGVVDRNNVDVFLALSSTPGG